MKPFAVFLAILLTATVCSADFLKIVPVPPAEPVMGGETLSLELIIYNTSDEVVTRGLPSSVPCKIRLGDSVTTVPAELVDAREKHRVVVAPGGFVKRRVRLTLPIYASGMAELDFDGFGILTLPVEKAPADQWVGHQVPLDKGPSMLQSFLANFSVYEPMYFLLGVSPGLEQSKVQFSFQYRPFNPKGSLPRRAPWLSGFHLAYTQRSVWDLEDESKPFTDISYLPELFYLWPTIELHNDRVGAFGVQAGYQHYSNGKGGEDSRSTNFLYVEPILGLYLMGPYHLKIAPRIFTYLQNDDDTNEDIADYWGYFDLKLGVANPDGVALDSHVWWAKEGATLQLDLTYALTKLFGKNLNFYLHGQYFNGYGETFLYYNERDEAFRLGFSVVR